LLAVTAFLNEGTLQGANLLVEKVIGLVDEANEGVRDNAGIGVGEPGEIIGRILGGAPYFAHGHCLRVGFAPLGKFALAEIIFVIEEEFVEAGAGHIDQP